MPSETDHKPEACPTHLISDQVTSEDAFQHGAIADAIADMILHEKGGCGIALTGSWGSGKSTVVELLKKKLEAESKEIETFIFDAWAHQGDPLRRSFLEKLIQRLLELKWTTGKKNWNEAVEELARRKEDIETTNTPNLTPVGAIGAISLLLAPAALQLYEKTQYEYHPVRTGIALLFGALPAILAFGALTYWLIERWKNKSKIPLPTLIYTSTENKIISKTSKTVDPTSVEFEKHYRDLLTEVLDGNQRELLFVIDNLDRIKHDEARSIWATLRVFFDPTLDGSSNWHRRVWVLVPFDPEAISDLWETNGGAGVALTTAMSHHFLEKTFQATFRVPPLILSNWKEYLEMQLKLAFPKHSAAEFHTIFRLYDRMKAYATEPTTPRNLKTYVNTIGALHRQWQDRIPLTEQAAFVLLTGQNENLPASSRGGESQLLLPDLPGGLSNLLGSDWPRNFSALYFNVDPKDAYQVLLSQPIRRAFQDGDGKMLVELERNPGFPEVTERIIEDICGNSAPIDGTALAHAAVAFSSLQKNWAGHATCRTRLCNAAFSLKEWSPFNQDIAKGIIHLVQMVPSSQDITPIIRSVQNSLKRQVQTSPELNAADWCAGIAVVLPSLAARNEATVKREFRVIADANQYLTVIDVARQTGIPDSALKYLHPTTSKDEVVNSLSRLATEGKWSKETVATVKTLLKVCSDWDWSPLVSASKTRIITPHQSLPADLPAILETVFLLSAHSASAQKVLVDAAQGDSLFQLIHFLPPNGQEISLAACILPLIDRGIQQIQGSFPPNTAQWFNQQGKQKILTIIENPVSNQPLLSVLSSECLVWHSVGEWRTVAEKEPKNRKIITAFLGNRLRDNNGIDICPEEFVQHIDFWKEVIGQESFDKIRELKARNGELSPVLIESPFDISKQDLYALILREDKSQAYQQYLIDSLRQIAEQTWTNAMSNETELIGIALSLKASGLELGQYFQDALAKHADQRYSMQATGNLSSVWHGLPKLLGDSKQSVLRQSFWNYFSSNLPQGSICGVIPYYGKLLTETVLEYGPEKAMKRIVQIIEAHRQTEIDWLAHTLSQWNPHSKSSKAIQDDWKTRIEKILESELAQDEKSALDRLLVALQPGLRSSTDQH